MNIKSFLQKASEAAIAALLFALPIGANASPMVNQAGEQSSITYEEQTLMKGQTYTSADFGTILSGSFSISDDGATMTFDNLKIQSPSSVFKMRNESLGTIVLKGENEIRTSNYVVIEFISGTFTIKGDGSLKTKSTWYDIFHSAKSIIIENTTLICEGPTAIGNNMWKDDDYFHLTVKNSLFTGNRLFRLSSLAMEGCLIKTPDNCIFDHEEMGGGQIKDKNGNIASSFVIDKVDEQSTLKSYDVSPMDFGTTYAQKGESVIVPVMITNMGKEPVTSISYTVSINGSISAETTLKIDKVLFQNATTIQVNLPIGNDPRRYDTALTITKVNGNANESSAKTANGTQMVISEKIIPVPVVEEFTGTWCGWCTVGYDGMEKTKETFGDKAVLIAVHAGDVMETSDYNPITKGVHSYPSSIINRTIDAYPSSGNLNYYINECRADITVGEIKVTASWADEGQTGIKVDTDTKFAYSEDNGQYGIALVLIEDGMTGTGSQWAQSNYLSGNSGYANDYPFWYSAPSKVTGVKFNHVAVGAWDIANGADGSVKSSFTAGEVLKYTRNIDISSKTIIQDKSKLKVAALLVDRTTGAVVNAAQTVISAPSSPETITIPAGGKLAMVSDKNLDFTTLDANGVKAYICTGYDVATKKLWMTRVNDVPANTPILVKGSAGDYNVPEGAASIYYPQNFLFGSAIADATVDKTAGYVNYGVSKSTGSIGPLPEKTTTFEKGKAYFHVPTSVASKTSAEKAHFEMGKGGKLATVSDYDLDFTAAEADGLKAYTVTAFDNKKIIWITRVMTASAGTPLLLRGTSEGKYDVASAATQMAYVNMMDGNTSDADMTITPEMDGSTIYVLSLGSGLFGPLGKEAKMAKGKAWLPVPTAFLSSIAASRGDSDMAIEESEVIFLTVDGNTTAIDKIAVEESEADVWYNLNGQRIDAPTKKGLYIRNGVKVFVK